MRNCGNLLFDAKEDVQKVMLKNLSTNANSRDGLACSSVEAFVMKVERRS